MLYALYLSNAQNNNSVNLLAGEDNRITASGKANNYRVKKSKQLCAGNRNRSIRVDVSDTRHIGECCVDGH